MDRFDGPLVRCLPLRCPVKAAVHPTDVQQVLTMERCLHYHQGAAIDAEVLIVGPLHHIFRNRLILSRCGHLFLPALLMGPL
jgi:hypothetical protein